MLAVGVHLPEAGSNSSALARADELFFEALPPTTSTWPLARSVAPCPQRASLRLPVRSQVPRSGMDPGEGSTADLGEPDGTETDPDCDADVALAGSEVGAADPVRRAQERATANAADTATIANAANAPLAYARERTGGPWIGCASGNPVEGRLTISVTSPWGI